MRLVQGLALRDLAARAGLDPAGMPALDEQPTPPMRHLRQSAPDLSWVAVRDGRVAGFSQGLVRGELWFLSNLFVHPNAQSSGVGAALLQKCIAAGIRRGARIRAVCSSPELAAQALYARNGMIPRFPLFAVEGSSQKLLNLPSVRSKIVLPKPTGVWLRKLGALDEYVWGRRRDADHRFAHSQAGLNCIAVDTGAAQPAGYLYYCPGQIGPLCARIPHLQLELLRAAGDALGQAVSGTLRVWVPGINAVVLVALLEAGFRIAFSNLFMASQVFGRFDRYLPSGGTLL